MNTKKTWIILANRGRAIIWDMDKKSTVVQSFENPEAFKKYSDIYSDRSGSGQTSNTQNNVALSEGHYMEEVNQKFANEIIHYLEKAQQTKRFENLILVSDKGFIGNIRRKLPNTIKDTISKELLKNFYTENPAELADFMEDSN